MMEFTVRFDHFVSPHDFGVEEGPVCSGPEVFLEFCHHSAVKISNNQDAIDVQTLGLKKSVCFGFVLFKDFLYTVPHFHRLKSNWTIGQVRSAPSLIQDNLST